MSRRFVSQSPFLSQYGDSEPVRLPLLARLPGGVRGVLFDLGNVLYDDTMWRRWMLRLLQHLGLQTHYRGFCRVWDREHSGCGLPRPAKFCRSLRDIPALDRAFARPD